MRNLKDLDEDGNNYDYSPYELADLNINNPRLYREIVSSNLEESDSIDNWEQPYLEWAKERLEEQRRNRR